MTSLEAQLAELLACSRQMLEQARLDEWQQVESLGRRRRALAASCFPLHDAGTAAHQAEKVLKAILAMQQETVALMSAKRDAVGAMLAKIVQGQHGVKAYRASVS